MRPDRRLLYVVTTPVTAKVLLRGQLRYMREAGFDVHVAASPGPELEEVAEREGVEVHRLPLAREISPREDAAAVLRAVQLMRRLRPRIVNASTAKGGLVGMIAARASRTPHRVYLLRGLRMETTSGATRRILATTERIASTCATRVVCVSKSLRDAYVASGCAPASKVTVLGGGSSNGFEPDRFERDDGVGGRAAKLRADLGIAEEAPVVGFVGRIVRDKGLAELLDAMEIIHAALPSARLLIVGAGFAGDRPDEVLARAVEARRDVHVVGHVPELRDYYAAMDVVAFPSHREGFPNVPMEAAAAGLPVVGSNATGVVDAIVDGETGRIVPQRDAEALAEALLAYLRDPSLRRAHGAAGRARVRESYTHERVWAGWRALYEEALSRRAS